MTTSASYLESGIKIREGFIVNRGDWVLLKEDNQEIRPVMVWQEVIGQHPSVDGLSLVCSGIPSIKQKSCVVERCDIPEAAKTHWYVQKRDTKC